MVANPAQVQSQIRFALSQLPAQNAHHLFEQLCRHLTARFICSNVLPATGPVSAGGDQGRDFETFRTYLRDELGPAGAFLGLVSEGTVAFICTTQADNVTSKIRSDIERVCSSGHPVHEIRAFTLAPVPVAARHALEAETHETYGVRLEFHDAESIADLLARPEGFWVAEHFLSLPAEIGTGRATRRRGSLRRLRGAQEQMARRACPRSHAQHLLGPEGRTSRIDVPPSRPG